MGAPTLGNRVYRVTHALVGADCSRGRSRSFRSGFFSTKYRRGPVVGEERDGLIQLVRAEAHPRRDDDARGVAQGRVRLDPPKDRPRRHLEARLGAVFALQAVLDDLELQGSDSRQERRARRGRAGAEGLHDPLLEQLVKAGPELLRVGRVGIGDVGEDLRREPGDLVEQDGAVLGQRVADPEGVVAHEPDDVPGPRHVHRLPVLAEELVRR